MSYVFEREADALWDEAARDNEARKILWRGVAAYGHAMEGTIADFAAVLHIDPETEAAEALWSAMHAAWMAGVRRYGFKGMRRIERIGWKGLMLNNGRLA